MPGQYLPGSDWPVPVAVFTTGHYCQPGRLPGRLPFYEHMAGRLRPPDRPGILGVSGRFCDDAEPGAADCVFVCLESVG